MVILFFSRLFYPHGGGVERHVLEVGKRLVKKGHKVIVVSEELPATYNISYQSKALGAKTTGSISGITTYRIPTGEDDWFKKFRIWKWLWQHKELIATAGIVHCHDVFFWYLPFRFLYPTKPVYTTFHGWETKFPPGKKAIFVRKISEKLSLGNICVGDYIKKWYGTKPTYVTYGGVEKSKIKNQKSKIKNDKKLRIVLIGRLEEDIGISIYLAALAILKKKKVDFELEAYGEGSLQKEVEKYGKVHDFTKNMGRVIRNLDFVFASSYLSIFEALAAKKMVFAAYDNELKKDYLQMTPFAKYVVIENSAEDLAHKIIYFKTHEKERLEIIELGYSFIKNQTWDKVTNLYLKLWKKV